MKYGNILPNHKNANMGSSTVNLHGVDLIQICKFKIDYKNMFLYDIRHINM